MDDPPSFDAEDWITKKKDYFAIPYFVRDACTKAFAIPAAQMKKLFPGPDISVVDLLKKGLPPRSSASISSTHLLTRLIGKTVHSQNGNLEIGMDDLRIFKSLCMEPERFQVATKMFAQRGKNKVAQESAAC